MSYEALPDGRSGIAAARHDAGWVASSLEWDRLDKAMDKLYHEVARGCGISDRAYWILSAIEESGGNSPSAGALYPMVICTSDGKFFGELFGGSRVSGTFLC